MTTPVVEIGKVDPCRFQKPEHSDPENIERIAADLEVSGLLTNPIHLIKKDGGRFECIAGHDRLAAAKKAGVRRVSYRDFTGKVATDEEVFEHWKKDNTLRKTTDKREDATETLVQFPTWSDRRIAEVCGCSHPFVAGIRAELAAAGQVETVTTSAGKDGKTYTRPAPKSEAERGGESGEAGLAPTDQGEHRQVPDPGSSGSPTSEPTEAEDAGPSAFGGEPESGASVGETAGEVEQKGGREYERRALGRMTGYLKKIGSAPDIPDEDIATALAAGAFDERGVEVGMLDDHRRLIDRIIAHAKRGGIRVIS